MMTEDEFRGKATTKLKGRSRKLMVPLTLEIYGAEAGRSVSLGTFHAAKPQKFHFPHYLFYILGLVT